MTTIYYYKPYTIIICIPPQLVPTSFTPADVKDNFICLDAGTTYNTNIHVSLIANLFRMRLNSFPWCS